MKRDHQRCFATPPCCNVLKNLVVVLLASSASEATAQQEEGMSLIGKHAFDHRQLARLGRGLHSGLADEVPPSLNSLFPE